MRFAFTLLALAAVTYAYILPRQSLPDCATACIAKADLDGCSSDDNSCLCHSSAFVQSSTTCIANTCDTADAQLADSLSQAICADVGVTLTSSSPSTSSAAPSSTAPPSQTTSSAPSAPPATSTSASTPTPSNGALSHNANAFAGVLAAGLVAFAL